MQIIFWFHFEKYFRESIKLTAIKEQNNKKIFGFI